MKFRGVCVKKPQKALPYRSGPCDSGPVAHADETLNKDGGQTAADRGSAVRRVFATHVDGWILLVAVAGPIATALVLTPWRGHLDTGETLCSWWW